MVLRGDVVHTEDGIAVFPTVRDTIAVGIWMRRVSHPTKASVEVLAFQGVDFRHAVSGFLTLFNKVLIKRCLGLYERVAQRLLVGEHGIFTEVDDTHGSRNGVSV